MKKYPGGLDGLHSRILPTLIEPRGSGGWGVVSVGQVGIWYPWWMVSEMPRQMVVVATGALAPQPLLSSNWRWALHQALDARSGEGMIPDHGLSQQVADTDGWAQDCSMGPGVTSRHGQGEQVGD